MKKCNKSNFEAAAALFRKEFPGYEFSVRSVLDNPETGEFWESLIVEHIDPKGRFVSHYDMLGTREWNKLNAAQTEAEVAEFTAGLIASQTKHIMRMM